MEDYYIDEIMIILDKYADMHKPKEEQDEEVYGNDF